MRDIGIDLGTKNVLIYEKGKGIILNEPSVVAIDINTKKVLAVGKEAYDMIGRTPGKVKAIEPMKDGVIADFEMTEVMLKMFMKQSLGKIFFRPRILICCPSNITQVEKNAIKEIAERTNAKKVYIEEEPKVAAVGAGLDISKPSGCMIIDIGGGTTDIAILSLGGIVNSSSIKIAGTAFDQDIVKYIKSKYKLLIGEKTAEDIKIKIGNVGKQKEKEKLEIKGRDSISGLPKTLEINESDIEEAIHNDIEKIISEAKKVLENVSPELSSDIKEKGAILTGGGSQIKGLAEIIKENLKIPVFISEDPLLNVAQGTGYLLDNIYLIEE